jgi:TRAP-type mannitol/chloroaromatic compound transport system permease large subunit
MMIASVFVVLVMVVLLCSSMWIGFALLGTGLLSLEWFRDVPIQRILAQDVWSRLNADELVTLPLFVLMGDILFFSKLSVATVIEKFTDFSLYLHWILIHFF